MSLPDRRTGFYFSGGRTAPFAALLHHPATRGVPFIVETPGSHAADVATLKALRQTRRPAPAPATRMR